MGGVVVLAEAERPMQLSTDDFQCAGHTSNGMVFARGCAVDTTNQVDGFKGFPFVIPHSILKSFIAPSSIQRCYPCLTFKFLSILSASLSQSECFP